MPALLFNRSDAVNLISPRLYFNTCLLSDAFHNVVLVLKSCARPLLIVYAKSVDRKNRLGISQSAPALYSCEKYFAANEGSSEYVV